MSPGTDGVLIHRKLGFASNLEIAYSPAKEPDNDSYAARYTFNHQGWDGQIIGGKSSHDRIVGFGFSGDINGAGVRGESSYFIADSEARSQQLSNTVISSLETDYSFNSQRNWAVKVGLLHTAPLPHSTQKPPNPAQPFTFLANPKSTKILLGTHINAIISGDHPLSKISFSLLPTPPSPSGRVWFPCSHHSRHHQHNGGAGRFFTATPPLPYYRPFPYTRYTHTR